MFSFFVRNDAYMHKTTLTHFPELFPQWVASPMTDCLGIMIKMIKVLMKGHIETFSPLVAVNESIRP